MDSCVSYPGYALYLGIRRTEVVQRQFVYIVVSGDAGEGTELLGGHIEIVGDPLRPDVYIQPLLQFRILSGDAHKGTCRCCRPCTSGIQGL